MKTARVTLLISPEEKASINRQASALGISASEFVRKAATLLDADDVAALEEIRSLLPQFNAALDRVHENLSSALAHSLESERELTRLRSEEYQGELRQQMASDRGIDWRAISALFGENADDRPSRFGIQPTRVSKWLSGEARARPAAVEVAEGLERGLEAVAPHRAGRSSRKEGSE